MKQGTKNSAGLGLASNRDAPDASSKSARNFELELGTNGLSKMTTKSVGKEIGYTISVCSLGRKISPTISQGQDLPLAMKCSLLRKSPPWEVSPPEGFLWNLIKVWKPGKPPKNGKMNGCCERKTIHTFIQIISLLKKEDKNKNFV